MRPRCQVPVQLGGPDAAGAGDLGVAEGAADQRRRHVDEDVVSTVSVVLLELLEAVQNYFRISLVFCVHPLCHRFCYANFYLL